MVHDQGYYSNDKRRRIEISHLIPLPPPPLPTFPGMVYPPHRCVGGARQETYSCNYNRRGGRGGRIHHFGRGEGGRRGRGGQGGRGGNRGGGIITDEKRLKGYYLPSFVEDPFGPLLSQLHVKSSPPPNVGTPVEVVRTDEMLPTVQQQPNATTPENSQEQHFISRIPVVEDTTKPHMPPKPVFDTQHSG
eukprot:421969_1